MPSSLSGDKGPEGGKSFRLFKKSQELDPLIEEKKRKSMKFVKKDITF